MGFDPPAPQCKGANAACCTDPLRSLDYRVDQPAISMRRLLASAALGMRTVSTP